jgi:aminomethyltransferase
MPDETLQTTPLHAAHVALGAKMAPFAGYDMPIQYTGILDEHRAVRTAAGLFDVSHMGEFRVRGPQAEAFVQRLVTNDAAALVDGKAMYAVLCHESGGAVDDLLVYRLGPDHFLLVVNASNRGKDWDHAQGVLAEGRFEAEMTDESDRTSLLALQGPKAFEIFEAATGMDASHIPYYHFEEAAPGAVVGAQHAIVSHTGYTGEKGLELYVENEAAEAVWNAILAAGEAHGLRPAGLGARDTLRLEAGYCLYGHELTDETTPLEAGLGWVVKPDAKEFVGREALVAQKAAGVPRRLVGLVCDGRGLPRDGFTVTDEAGAPVGTVTSGSQSPVLGTGVALALVENRPDLTAAGTRLAIDVRGRPLAATVTKPPFHTPK